MAASSFYNPMISKRSKAPARKERYVCKDADYVKLSPTCLRDPGAKGLTIDTGKVAKMRCAGKEYSCYDVAHDLWPVRIGTWQNTPLFDADRHGYSTADGARLRVHVYDVTTTYCANHAKAEFTNVSAPISTVPILFGRTERGHTVAVKIFDVQTYYYAVKRDVDVAYDASTCENVERIFRHPPDAAQTAGGNRHQIDVRVSIVTRKNIYGFDIAEAEFYKFAFKYKKHATLVKARLCAARIQLYEGNTTHVTRLFCDHEILPFAWYALKRTYHVPYAERHTDAQLEVDCFVDDLEVDRDATTVPEYTLMAIDIETVSHGPNENKFPDAQNQEDIIVQISAVVYDGVAADGSKYLFAIGEAVVDDASVTVVYSDSEYELLIAFLSFFKQVAPEMLTGYNLMGFDLSFVIKKAEMYHVNTDGYGRKNEFGEFYVSQLHTNAFQKKNKARINGTLIFDMLDIVRTKVSLPNYKLNTVSKHVVNDCKEDLPYKQIPGLFRDGPRGRGKIGAYCVQDSLLTGKLFYKYTPHLEAGSVANIAKLPVNRVLTDGQQILVLNCLLMRANADGYVIPDRRFDTSNRTKDIGYKGATVLEPDNGFYDTPVAVFDFASLYPSIIQAHNLCYTTMTSDETCLRRRGLMLDRDYIKVPLNEGSVYFVKRHVRRSLLSDLLTDWLTQRKAIRANIAKATSEQRILLNKEQLAIKVTCNSVYGFTGTATGYLPCLPVAATVTHIGRRMLLDVTDYVHTKWNTADGLANDVPSLASDVVANDEFVTKVIYGDTDSVFVMIRGVCRNALMRNGDAMADAITRRLFAPPIKLECEKIFKKLLLITKKRYVGDVGGASLLMKGVDLVRKSNCAFVNDYVSRMVKCLFDDVDVASDAQRLSSERDRTDETVPISFGRFGALVRKAHEEIAYYDAINLGRFVMSTELSKTWNSYAHHKMPHLQVYKKLVDRGEQPPNVKDRIQYVFTAGASKLCSELAEDPEHVALHKLPLNVTYYMDRLFCTVASMFKVFFNNDARAVVTFLSRNVPVDGNLSHEITLAADKVSGLDVVSLTGNERRIFETFPVVPKGMKLQWQ